MKALLTSALALGVATAVDTGAYYVGNYTANGQVKLVPYPLGVCVATGAVSGFVYSIFTCDGDNVLQKKFQISDTTCADSYTTATLPKHLVPGLEGYTNCDGPLSYMLLNQYISNCKLWKKGQGGIATTTIALGACTYTTTVNGIPLYSRSTCDGDSQLINVYAADETCSTPDLIVNSTTSTHDCRYFTTESGLNIYTALETCVIDGEAQRCTTPLADYEATLTLEDVDDNVDYELVFTSLFEDATVTVMGNTTAGLYLSLGFCSEYEDAKYASLVESLGDTVLDSPYISDTAAVCWTCTDFICSDELRCGLDDYCVKSEQCATGTTTTTEKAEEPETTEPANSANGVYASFSLMMALFLSWILF